MQLNVSLCSLKNIAIAVNAILICSSHAAAAPQPPPRPKSIQRHEKYHQTLSTTRHTQTNKWCTHSHFHRIYHVQKKRSSSEAEMGWLRVIRACICCEQLNFRSETATFSPQPCRRMASYFCSEPSALIHAPYKHNKLKYQHCKHRTPWGDMWVFYKQHITRKEHKKHIHIYKHAVHSSEGNAEYGVWCLCGLMIW